MIPARLRPLSRTTGAAALRSPRRAPLVPGLFSLALALALVSCGGDRGASNPSANGGASKRGAPIELSRGTSLDLHPAFAPDGRSLAFCSDRNGRSEIWLRSLDDGSERAITNDSQDNYTPAFRPDGGLIAYSSKERRGIWVIPPEGGEPRRLTEFGSRPVFSPDGKTIVFQSEGVVEQSSTSVSAMPPSTLWSVTSDGGVPTPLTTAGSPPGGHGSPAFSPDGRFIAFVANDPQSAEIWIIPAAGGAPLPFVRHEKFNYDPVFSPDGKMLYFCIASKDFTYWIGRVPFDSSTGAPSGSAGPIASIPQGAVKHVAISPDGKRLAYSIVWTQSNLWSVPLDSKTSEPSGPPRAITNDKARNTTPRFSGDGAELAFVRWLAGRNPGDLWMMKADGSELRRLTSHPDFETQPTWRSDRSAVSFVSNRGGKLALYQVDVENGLEELLSDVDPEMDRVFVSPDGTRLVWHSKRGTGIMNVWTMDLADKKPRQLTFDKEMMGFPCWSPDGKWIAIEVKRGEDDHVGVLPSTGGPVALLTSGAGRNWPHSFSPDGDKVTVSAMRNGVWDVRWISRKTKEERPVILPVKRSAFVRYPEWSPRGDQIVYEYGETTGRIWLAAVPN